METHRFQRAAGKVQGSKQAFLCITSEQRTDNVGCAGKAPDIAHTSADGDIRTRVVPQR